MFNCKVKPIIIVMWFIISSFISCKTGGGIKSPPLIIEETTTSITIITTTTTTTVVVETPEIKEPVSKELGDIILERFKAVEDAAYKKDFNTWYKYLSKDYKNFLNNKAKMKDLSEKTVYLVKSGIVLNTPEDYFKYVVIYVRAGRTMVFDKFEKVSNNRVKVYCRFANVDSYTYIYDYLYQDNEWKLEY